jgi:hypothetical protein
MSNFRNLDSENVVLLMSIYLDSVVFSSGKTGATPMRNPFPATFPQAQGFHDMWKKSWVDR